jgi:hypothetical protein
MGRGQKFNAATRGTFPTMEGISIIALQTSKMEAALNLELIYI